MTFGRVRGPRTVRVRIVCAGPGARGVGPGAAGRPRTGCATRRRGRRVGAPVVVSYAGDGKASTARARRCAGTRGPPAAAPSSPARAVPARAGPTPASGASRSPGRTRSAGGRALPRRPPGHIHQGQEHRRAGHAGVAPASGTVYWTRNQARARRLRRRARRRRRRLRLHAPRHGLDTVEGRRRSPRTACRVGRQHGRLVGPAPALRDLVDGWYSQGVGADRPAPAAPGVGRAAAASLGGPRRDSSVGRAHD